jgi:hypothetical protein
MSALSGQKQKSISGLPPSALTLGADISSFTGHVRKVPIAEVAALL